MRASSARRGPHLLAAALLAIGAAALGGSLRTAPKTSAAASVVLTASLHGTEDALVGQSTTYTLVVQNTSADTDAGALEYSLSLPRAAATIASFSDPGATCVDYTTASMVGVICEQPGLGRGQQVVLSVQVTFVGSTLGAVTAQAKAANSAFAYGGVNLKVNPAPARPRWPWNTLPVAAGAGAAAPNPALAAH